MTKAGTTAGRSSTGPSIFRGRKSPHYTEERARHRRELDHQRGLLNAWGPRVQRETRRKWRQKKPKGAITERFSVFNARSGPWQKAKGDWLELGIRSDDGRGDNLLGLSATVLERGNGTSVFDPVLCDLIYRTFLPKCGKVLDPFAGGSVRGVTAAKNGSPYLGIELSEVQIKANVKQAKRIVPGADLVWAHGDARDIVAHVHRAKGNSYAADLVFTCPPYHDLERYSDDPRDLSAMSWPEFVVAYADIIEKSCSLLRDNRFAVIVVGEVRGQDGFYRGLVPETIRTFEKAGLHYYTRAVLVTPIGSGALRANRVFRHRKLVNTHQDVLVFVKGEAERAAAGCAARKKPR